MRSKIRSALMYPIAVMAVALGILVLILVLVVPVFQDVFQSFGAELPLATQLVVGMSNALVRAWPAALPLALVLLWAGQHTARQPAVCGNGWHVGGCNGPCSGRC
jgi:type IV pilus assembly protein PilC